MTCPACRRENRAGRKFCAECGARLDLSCPSCGAVNEPGANFCGECGQNIGKAEGRKGRTTARPNPEPLSYTPKHLAEKILRSRSALEGERKQVTVLFADVKGSMEIAGRLDPEDWHRILDRFFAILTEGVHRFEGTVNQYTGDGIMALFGAPVAHEDHAQRACYAALHLLQEVRAYAREVKRAYAVDFAVRIGLHSGEVVVGSIGDDLRMDYTAQGQTVGLAQRLESLAEPNTCFVSHATAAIVRGYFALEDLGTFPLKGVAEPARVFVLRGVGAVRTRFDASRARGLTRFVGRENDLRTLEDALARAQGGHGQVVGIVAEAGAGKSRLCFEFAERCRARGFVVLEGQGLAHGKHLPLLPMLQVFRAYYRIDESDDDRTVREKIAGRMLLLDEKFREALPVLFDFFGVPDAERPAPRMDPDARQRFLFAALRKLVQRDDPSGTQYLTLVEDLHWMDAASEAFLAEWVDAMAAAPRLLVVNFRPEYRASWMQKSYYRQIPLTPLGLDATRELIADLLGNDPGTAGLCEAIHARAAGNPFFTEEIVRSLIESGHLQGENGSYRLATELDQLEVPSAVQPLLASRIDRLGEREKHVLHSAAVIGKQFAEPVLARVVDLPPRELAESLAALKAAEFLYEEALYPVSEWAFQHPLTQEVALGSQLRERRSARHAAVARAIEELHATKLDEHSALLAHHWEEAGEAVASARWHRRAAERIGGTDARSSRYHWQRVRDLVSEEVADAETAALVSDACFGLLSAGWRLGLSPEEAAEILEAGKTWADRAGSVERAVRLEAMACVTKTVTGDCAGGLEHSRIAEELARGLPDPNLYSMVRFQGAYDLYHLGPWSEACERMDELIARAREHGDLPAVFGGETILALVTQLRSQLEAVGGSVERAYRMADEALRIARERGLLESEGWACSALSTIEWIDGDVARALPRCRRALEVAEEIGSVFSVIWALDALASVLAHAGERDSLELAERCVALARERNTSLEGEAHHLASLAGACIVTGDFRRACLVAAEASEVARKRGVWMQAPRAALVEARALRLDGGGRNGDRIREVLSRAEDMARRTGTVNYLLLALLERAALAELEGDAATQRTLLTEAARGFEKIGASFRVEQIGGWLDAAR
ncbi:MAG: hypothetical protein KatS3mg076_2977 [Candidatus Binatia bacterium]|nr:MAG: hypothetical protein KatS3mg076_2977 [Candidatus Binatia bacterium]